MNERAGAYEIPSHQIARVLKKAAEVKPWLVSGFIVNPFTKMASSFAVWQSKRAAKVKRSHRNRRAK